MPINDKHGQDASRTFFGYGVINWKIVKIKDLTP